MTDASGEYGPGLIRAAVRPFVAFVGAGEPRRFAVIVAVSLLFWLVVELGANLGSLPLVVAAALGAFLYTRETAKETIAASAYGTGLLAIGLGLLQVYQILVGGSTESLAGAVVRLAEWPLAGFLLIGFGIWLYVADL